MTFTLTVPEPRPGECLVALTDWNRQGVALDGIDRQGQRSLCQ